MDTDGTGLMRDVEAVIFDCFGVIITDALLALTNELASRDPAAAQQVSDIVKANNRGYISPDESNVQIAELLGMSLQDFQRRKYGGEVKDEALMGYIASLRPQYKTAMLSNVGGGSLDRRFTAEELERCFDQVVASGEIGYAKPDIEAYRITARRLGVEPEACIFIDDREHYCTGARQAGMQAVQYVSFAELQAELERILPNQRA